MASVDVLYTYMHVHCRFVMVILACTVTRIPLSFAVVVHEYCHVIHSSKWVRKMYSERVDSGFEHVWRAINRSKLGREFWCKSLPLNYILKGG